MTCSAPIIRTIPSIDDLLPAISECGGYIAGGYVRWMITEDNIRFGDIDIFSTTPAAHNKLLLLFEQYAREDKPYSVDFTHRAVEGGIPITISLIKPITDGDGRQMWGTPEELINQFDFTMLMGYYRTPGAVVYANKEARADAIKRKLVFNYLESPRRAFTRLFKYARKGFDVPLTTFMELTNAFKEIPADEYAVLWAVANKYNVMDRFSDGYGA